MKDLRVAQDAVEMLHGRLGDRVVLMECMRPADPSHRNFLSGGRTLAEVGVFTAVSAGADRLRHRTRRARRPGVRENDQGFTAALAKAVGLHRVWARAVGVMASEVAPVR